MGEAKLYNNGKSELKINGTEYSYPVFAGQTIKAGNFVQIEDGIAKNTTTAQFDGVAKTSGSNGSTIKVYTPPLLSHNLVKNGDFSDGTTGWELRNHTEGVNFSVVNGKAVLTTLDDSGHYAFIITYLSVVQDHIYYLRGEVTAGSITTPGSFSSNSGGAWINYINVKMEANTTKQFSARDTSTGTTDNGYVSCSIYCNVVGATLSLDNIRFYDLTQMFGAGNEPDKAWCDENL